MKSRIFRIAFVLCIVAGGLWVAFNSPLLQGVDSYHSESFRFRITRCYGLELGDRFCLGKTQKIFTNDLGVGKLGSMVFSDDEGFSSTEPPPEGTLSLDIFNAARQVGHLWGRPLVDVWGAPAWSITQIPRDSVLRIDEGTFEVCVWDK